MKHTHPKSPSTRRLARIGSSRRLYATKPWSQSRALGTAAGAACAPVDYSLPGVFQARKRKSPDTSWATLLAILTSWRDDKTLSEEEALQILGPDWVDSYKAAKALTPDETALLLGNAGLCTSAPQVLSSEAWGALLRVYGPLAIIGPDVASVRLPSDARVVFGVSGDGSMTGTRLKFTDIATGDVGEITLEKLGGPFRLVHWHADAGLACANRATAPLPVSAEPAASPAEPAAPPNGTAAARASSWMPRMLSTPKWDLPANFPSAVRAFWAKLDSRLHHFVWHDARNNWPNLRPGVRRAFDRLGFSPPPRTTGAAGSGVDFLNMHRQMISATRALAMQLGLEYRPTGWNPIPWDHTDAVWPMPSWPGPAEEFKQRDITAYWRAQVRDNLTNDAWLAGLTLDQLGQALESGIHNWFHMHWSTPQPSNATLQSEDPSNDWLGSTFSSQVNPTFWKLHGWIDECIERWENAPVSLGRPRRSAADDFKKFNWLGPVPTPPATAKSMAAHHHHGSDISDAELRELVADIDFTAEPSFPFASLPRDQLVARFGAVGEIPIAWLEEIEPSTARMASLGVRKRRIVVGFERHGVRAMNPLVVVGEQLLEKGIEWVVGEVTKRADGTRFVVTTQDASAGFPDAALQPWTRTVGEFEIEAKYPEFKLIGSDLTKKPARFVLKLVFEHNDANIRGATIGPSLQRSTPIDEGQFSITFAPQNETPAGSRSAQLAFLITQAKWDPGIGDRQFNFTGKLTLEASGRATLSLDNNTPTDVVYYDPWPGMNVISRDSVATPTRVRRGPPKPIRFEFDSAKITDDGMQILKDWFNALKPDTLLFGRLSGGHITIHVDGHASAPGSGEYNQKLSRQRAEKVAALLQEWFGAGTSKPDLKVAPQGERAPGAKSEKDDPNERRVDVYYYEVI